MNISNRLIQPDVPVNWSSSESFWTILGDAIFWIFFRLFFPLKPPFFTGDVGPQPATSDTGGSPSCTAKQRRCRMVASCFAKTSEGTTSRAVREPTCHVWVLSVGIYLYIYMYGLCMVYLYSSWVLYMCVCGLMPPKKKKVVIPGHCRWYVYTIFPGVFFRLL